VAALDGRVALVAGASSGIGRAAAEALADAGATVHAAARRAEAIPNPLVAHALDVSDREAVRALAGELGGRLDILVVAAGTNLPERAFDVLTPEGWDELLAVNLTGAFNLMHALREPLRAATGHVVLIGSVSGSWPDRSGVAYQAAKAGMLALARAAAFEERHGVRYTTILPGVVDTEILDRRPEPPSAETRAQMLRPEDVAAACVFAVSLPPRAYVPELTILPTALQALGRTT
jgi:NAD(P)-dependent dehydrogenase (short-subunit alcohol dehydrogenase family)